MNSMANSRTRDLMRFLRAWMSDPLRVGAVCPSGQALARTITSEITPSDVPIIELGAGTGVFTRALLDRGIPQDRLVLIDLDPKFVASLNDRFPAARILRLDASRLTGVDLLDGEAAGAVVSGLPILAMQPRKMYCLLKGAFAHLRPDAAFYQFTYGPGCPVPRAVLDRLGLTAVRIGGALANLPPASVYRISRLQPATRPRLDPRPVAVAAEPLPGGA